MNANRIQQECVYMLQAYKRCRETSSGSLCVEVLLLQYRDGISQKGFTVCFMTFMGREVRCWLDVMYRAYLQNRDEGSRGVKAFKIPG